MNTDSPHIKKFFVAKLKKQELVHMFDDFFTRALIAGIGVALIAGPMGCLIIWRRMAFFGDTLAHASLFGVVLALLFELNFTFIVFLVCGGVSLILFVLQRKTELPADSLLGLLAHSSLAVGLVGLSFLPQVTFDLSSILFGDILSVSQTDIFIIYGSGGFCFADSTLVLAKNICSDREP